MTSSFFFLQASKNQGNQAFIEKLEKAAFKEKEQIYVISRPLGDDRYSYPHSETLVVLSPKRKIAFVDFSNDENAASDFMEDFLEDLASLSDKYRYKEAIGRPRAWRSFLVTSFSAIEEEDPFRKWRQRSTIDDPAKQRLTELLVSLLTGSINDIERVKADLPDSLLDKVKRKIVLFDGDQTRFIYQKPSNSTVRIQGLSGTGKTELLLHKLRELYVNAPGSKIVFTCHNKILADNMARRIPDFFNFMKVEEQIAWEARLWCFHAWGSANLMHSGFYRLVCQEYRIQFQRYSHYMTFDRACKEAIAELKNISEFEPKFDYMLVDESQDFPDSFIELCEMVTKKNVYVAGDIFQSIFDEKIAPTIEPDYLLSKCYRTDPRTLMFAHAIGMGLFEKTKLRWLDDNEWKACGYLVTKLNKGTLYRLTREPLRRFEDVDISLPSVILEAIDGAFWSSAARNIISAIQKIAHENPTLTPDDVGIILLDGGNKSYSLSDQLDVLVPRELGWQVNKAYETKKKVSGELFISNRNNVKGLEFPFVICVTEAISSLYTYRNALYMTLTRSFIQSYLITSSEWYISTLEDVTNGLALVNEKGCIEVAPPTEPEKAKIRTTIRSAASSMSFYDTAMLVFDELEVMPLMRDQVFDAMKKLIGEDLDLENIRETAEFVYNKMTRAKI